MIWTFPARAKAARLWSEGLSCREIALQINCTTRQVNDLSCRNRDLFPKRTPEQISEILKRKPISRPKKPSKHQKHIRKAAKLWRQGKIAREIAEALGLTKIQVEYMIATNRIRFRLKHGGPTIARRPGALKLI